MLVANSCNLVFTIGGLGPTHDDKTLEGVANAYDLPVEINIEALNIVTRQYSAFHERGIINSKEITEPRRKMACLPLGSIPLDNRVGGAPGVLLSIEDLQIVNIKLSGASNLDWSFFLLAARTFFYSHYQTLRTPLALTNFSFAGPHQV